MSSSPRVSQFAFSRWVAVGMSMDEVVLLVGPPVAPTQERACMQEGAKEMQDALASEGIVCY